ncbi:MAG: elongation factor 4 [Candidatus Sungbacteria bacterium]|uniref:Elongation factor 4 n=1 Tax=Candidatus Sungiibacteriota bacterium TaxID=2750080 RepID=A0A932QY78_9BACT|nr:elongation factor 4 [Candidatus Sungbacteria bacterium]
MDPSHIRNFSIIAHIDHGKSTLADRFLELTGSVEKRKMREQFLDMHPLERERGITIKMQPVRMQYQDFVLNLIDTPGHVDFSYEVSRALAAVEGAILLVDATQGIQAQTLANLYAAREEKLVIVPALNKIDLPSADIARTEQELADLLGIPGDRIFKISGKVGTGVKELLDGVVAGLPPPARGTSGGNGRQGQTPLRALIFDSKYDQYLGVIAHVRIREGRVKKGDGVRCMASNSNFTAEEVGVFLPERGPVPELSTGEIGYIATGIKEPASVRVGDTITSGDSSRGYSRVAVEPLPGYREPAPVVWASLFPENQDEYEILRDALKKLQLEDAALVFTPEDAGVVGRGFRAGFLGVLHMEIIAERIRREYGIRVVFSRPSVSFRVTRRGGVGMLIQSAHTLPEPQDRETMEEPWTKVTVIAPARFLGVLQTLIHERGGQTIETISRGADRLQIAFFAPLREIIVDFYDILKSATQGFASMAYEPSGWRRADLVRLDMLVAGERIHALSEIVPTKDAYEIGRARVAKLKELLPRALFPIALQASSEGRIIARETIPALKKDVTGYLYGGDRTRKMKLWKKQQRGKKRLEASGRVEVGPEIFFKLLGR